MNFLRKISEYIFQGYVFRKEVIMGFIQETWKTICSFFLGVWDSFCTVLKGIVKFMGTIYDFLDSLFENIIDLIADGIASLFIIMFGDSKKSDPLAQELTAKIEEAQRTGKIPTVILNGKNKSRIAAKVENGKVTDYKAYEIDENTDYGEMQEVEKELKKECIVQIGV